MLFSALEYVTFEVLHVHLSLITFNTIEKYFQCYAEKKKRYTIYHYLTTIAEIKLRGTAVMWLEVPYSYHSFGTGFAVNIYHLLFLLP